MLLNITTSIPMHHTAKVTVQSFAADLWERLLLERPDLLRKLGISESGTLAGLDDLAFEEFEADPDAAFDDLMVMNRRFLDGIRGVLTFMVRFQVISLNHRFTYLGFIRSLQ